MKGTYKTPLKDCIKITPNGHGWITDGHLAIQTKAMKKPPKFTTNGQEMTWDLFKDHIAKLYPKSIQAWPRFYYLNEPGCNGVSSVPIPCETPKRADAVIWVQSVTGEWQSFNQHLFNHLSTMAPDFYTTINHMLFAVKDGEPIGLVMAMRTECLDHALELAKEANLIEQGGN